MFGTEDNIIFKTQNWKVGQKVVCCNNVSLESNEIKTLTIGKHYIIEDFLRDIAVHVIDDSGNYAPYYNFHFNSIQHLRKEKLEKIKNS